MLDTDLPAVSELANATHSELPESPGIFAERLNLYPVGCFVVEDEGVIRGYIISHPIAKDQPPALDKMLKAIPAEADVYYIHDLVVSSYLRGRGLAGDGITKALSTATHDGYSSTCLISVYGTAQFWGKHGFKKQMVEGDLAQKLQGYGSDAVFMIRSNDS
jgi:ribosomal protein S18 acetylase RimI-like enzyme